jgi:hypothetical protein
MTLRKKDNSVKKSCHQSHIKLISTRTYYKTIILPVALYACETWSLILREEHRLRVFGNRVLRGIFGSKRD